MSGHIIHPQPQQDGALARRGQGGEREAEGSARAAQGMRAAERGRRLPLQAATGKLPGEAKGKQQRQQKHQRNLLSASQG